MSQKQGWLTAYLLRIWLRIYDPGHISFQLSVYKGNPYADPRKYACQDQYGSYIPALEDISFFLASCRFLAVGCSVFS